jgi:RNA polymerase sigma-70 factor (sigma-E family)
MEDDFREFVVVQWQPLRRVAYLVLGDWDDADDVVQTVLQRMHRHWRRITSGDTTDAYARRAVVNEAISCGRRRTRRLALLVSQPDTAPDAYALVEARDELWRALLTLPPRMRATLVLRYFEDLSEAETAAVLECSVGSVKSQCSRGLQRLSQVVDDNRVLSARGEPT